MTYFANFIKNGDPNSQPATSKHWPAYATDKAYLRISADLLEPSQATLATNHTQIRDQLHQVWTLDDERHNGGCRSYQSGAYNPGLHTSGAQPALDTCFAELSKSNEYRYLGEHFLIEYEHCLKLLDSDKFHSLLTTVCLDAIAIRRLIIEHTTCCRNDSRRITSTLCSFEAFNTEYDAHNLTSLMRLVNERYPPEKEHAPARLFELVQVLRWAVAGLCVTCVASLAVWAGLRARRGIVEAA